MAALVEVRLEVAPPARDAAAAILWDLGVGAVGVDDGPPAAVYTSIGARARTSARRTLATAVVALEREFGPVTVTFRPLPDTDWRAAWREHYAPIAVGSVTVLPAWWEGDPPAGPTVRIEPGQAFGSGQHASTRTTLLALERAMRPGASVIDVGTGTGILALAARALGAGRTRALDLSRDAVALTRVNARINNQDIEVRAGTLAARGPRADLLVMNIVADVVLSLLPRVPGRLEPHGAFVAGGVRVEREPEVTGAARALGLACVGRVEEDGWIALTFRA